MADHAVITVRFGAEEPLVEFPAEGITVSVPLTPIGGRLYRLDGLSFLAESARFGDVIEDWSLGVATIPDERSGRPTGETSSGRAKPLGLAWAASPFVVIAVVLLCVGPFDGALDFALDTVLAVYGALFPAVLVWAMLNTPGSAKLTRWVVAALLGMALTLLMLWNLVALYAHVGLRAVPVVPGWEFSARPLFLYLALLWGGVFFLRRIYRTCQRDGSHS